MWLYLRKYPLYTWAPSDWPNPLQVSLFVGFTTCRLHHFKLSDISPLWFLKWYDNFCTTTKGASSYSLQSIKRINTTSMASGVSWFSFFDSSSFRYWRFFISIQSSCSCSWEISGSFRSTLSLLRTLLSFRNHQGSKLKCSTPR